jgi:hypothetical protein
MPVTFSLDGPSIHMAETIADWCAFDLSRADQWHRSTLAGRLNRLADGIADSGGYQERAEKWQRARDIRIIANSIQNNGALGGSCGGLHWSLELEPAAKPADDEAA